MTNEKYVNFILELSERDFAEVVGKLNSLGAWIDQLETGNEQTIVRFRAESRDSQQIRQYFNNLTEVEFNLSEL